MTDPSHLDAIESLQNGTVINDIYHNNHNLKDDLENQDQNKSNKFINSNNSNKSPSSRKRKRESQDQISSSSKKLKENNHTANQLTETEINEKNEKNQENQENENHNEQSLKSENNTSRSSLTTPTTPLTPPGSPPPLTSEDSPDASQFSDKSYKHASTITNLDVPIYTQEQVDAIKHKYKLLLEAQNKEIERLDHQMKEMKQDLDIYIEVIKEQQNEKTLENEIKSNKSNDIE